MKYGNIALVIRHSNLHITLVNNPQAFNTVDAVPKIVADAVEKSAKDVNPACACAALMLGLRSLSAIVPAGWFWAATDPTVEHLFFVDYEEAPLLSYGKGRMGTDMYEWPRREFTDVAHFLAQMTATPTPKKDGEADGDSLAKIKAKVAAIAAKGKAAPAPEKGKASLGAAIRKLADKGKPKPKSKAK